MRQRGGDPERRVLAVFDTAAAADAADLALGAGGIQVGDIERLEGAADADALDATGSRHGLGARLRRAVQFSLMDQMPALAWYEAALRDGRVVLAVRTGDRAMTLRAVGALQAAGGHFVNRFGRLQTEEFARWRGPEPAISSLLK
jgi:hypothetical protein